MAGYKFTYNGMTYSADDLTPEDRDASMVRDLKDAGYRPAKWFEFWRAGETQLPASILRQLEEHG